MRISLILFIIWATLGAYCQQSLAGLTFSNPNIMSVEMDKIEADVLGQRDAEIAKIEKKEGRPLTKQELAKIDEEMAKAKEMMVAFRKGFAIGITVRFLSDNKMEMRTDFRIDEALMKAAGMGWFKRKSMKATLALIPKSFKDEYKRQGSMVIMSPTDDPDTLRLSPDGRQLTGLFDKDTPFILQRQ